MITKWMTWDNRVIELKNITHQHLSNIFYYTHYIMGKYYSLSTKIMILFLLNNNFSGILLPYRPDPKFEFEKKYLKEQGFLQNDGTIIISGNKIGKYEN